MSGWRRMLALGAAVPATFGMGGTALFGVTAPQAKAPAAFACGSSLQTQGDVASIQTRLGTFSATLYGIRPRADSPLPFLGKPVLAVSYGRRTWRFPNPAPAGSGLIASPAGVYPNSLCALSLPSLPGPLVVSQFYTGGAHCCFEVSFFYFSQGSYRRGLVLTEQGGHGQAIYDPNSGLAPLRVGSTVLLVSDDGRFDYRFSCFACGGGPEILLSWHSGRLVDVTRHYRSLIAKDAARWWQAVSEGLRNPSLGVLGSLAPWVADECMLGRASIAWATVVRLEREGKLSSPAAFDGEGAAYVTNLKRFLSATGYCRAT
jgi:hypothetical protein